MNGLPAILAPDQFRRLQKEQSDRENKGLASTGQLIKERNRTLSGQDQDAKALERHSRLSIPSRKYWLSVSPDVKSQIAATATLLWTIFWTARSYYIHQSEWVPRMRDILHDRPSRQSRAILAAGQALWRYYLPIMTKLQEFADRIP